MVAIEMAGEMAVGIAGGSVTIGTGSDTVPTGTEKGSASAGIGPPADGYVTIGAGETSVKTGAGDGFVKTGTGDVLGEEDKNFPGMKRNNINRAIKTLKL